MGARSAKDLIVCQKAYSLGMDIFRVTQALPKHERYGLTSQIRRSSRSVCLNLREACAKRRYAAHFISKLANCDGENSETDRSLDFARDCGYPATQEHQTLTARCEEIGRMLSSMIHNPTPFLLTANS